MYYSIGKNDMQGWIYGLDLRKLLCKESVHTTCDARHKAACRCFRHNNISIEEMAVEKIDSSFIFLKKITQNLRYFSSKPYCIDVTERM